jgi:hypothetical protein
MENETAEILCLVWANVAHVLLQIPYDHPLERNAACGAPNRIQNALLAAWYAHFAFHLYPRRAIGSFEKHVD